MPFLVARPKPASQPFFTLNPQPRESAVKTFFTIALVSAFIALCGATPPNQKTTKTFKSERVSGDVRVTLIRADRTTVFSGALSPRVSENQDRYATGVSVLYVVEALGTEPVKWEFENTSAVDKAVFIDGTTMVGRDANNSGSRDYESFSVSWGRKPKASNPQRALICEDFWWDVQFPNGKFDLYIRKGFNGKIEEIRFTGIPIE